MTRLVLACTGAGFLIFHLWKPSHPSCQHAADAVSLCVKSPRKPQKGRKKKQETKIEKKYAALVISMDAAVGNVLLVLFSPFKKTTNNWTYGSSLQITSLICFPFLLKELISTWTLLEIKRLPLLFLEALEASHRASRATGLLSTLTQPCMSCSCLVELLGLLKVHPAPTPSLASHFQTLSVGLLAEGCESNPEDGGEIPSSEPGYNSLAIFPCGKIKSNRQRTANQLAMTSSAMCLCSYRALSQAGLLLPTPTWSKINITVAARGSGRYSAPFCQQSSVSVASFLLFPECRSLVRPHIPLYAFLHRPVWVPARLILPLIHLSLHLFVHNFGSLGLSVIRA